MAKATKETPMANDKPIPFPGRKYKLVLTPLLAGPLLNHVSAELEESGSKQINEIWDELLRSGFSHYLLRQIMYYVPFTLPVVLEIDELEMYAPGSVHAKELWEEHKEMWREYERE